MGRAYGASSGIVFAGHSMCRRQFHATITDEQALKLKLVMVQEATELVGRPRENK